MDVEALIKNIPDAKQLGFTYNRTKGEYGSNRVGRSTAFDYESERNYINKIYDAYLASLPEFNAEIYTKVEEQRRIACDNILDDLSDLFFAVYIDEERFSNRLRETISKMVWVAIEREVPGNSITIDYHKIIDVYLRQVDYFKEFIWMAHNDKTFDNSHCY